jgi:hypothetical protein
MIEIDRFVLVPFHWLDPVLGGSNLGRAEFAVCIKYRRRKISDVYVYTQQQREAGSWHLATSRNHFMISSYQGLEDAKVWSFSWCSEHKTQSFRLYVPTNSKILKIDCDGLSFWKERP